GARPWNGRPESAPLSALSARLPDRRHSRKARWCPVPPARAFRRESAGRAPAPHSPPPGISASARPATRGRKSRRESSVRAACGGRPPSCVSAQGGDHFFVGVALEGNDQTGKLFQIHPLKGREFRLMGGEIDIGILAGEAHGEPFLLLALVLAVES